MEKQSFYAGKAHALYNLGFTEERIKVAFVQEGLSKEAADELIKEAFWGRLAGMAVKGLGALGRGAGTAAKAAGKWGGQGIAKGTRMGNLQGKVGIQAGRAAKGLQKGFQGMQTAPLKTLGGGVKNFGSGVLMGGGKGVGGAMGKGMFAAGTASMLMPGGGGAPQPQQQRYQY